MSSDPRPEPSAWSGDHCCEHLSWALVCVANAALMILQAFRSMLLILAWAHDSTLSRFVHLQADAVVPEWDPIVMASVDEEAEAMLRDCRVFAPPTLKED